MMTCLVHNSKYRYQFHAVVNELRNENRLPVMKLKSMPRQCCTCNGVDSQTLTTVNIHEKEKLIKLKKLIDHVGQNELNDPQLIFALNRIEKFIYENQVLDKNILSTSAVGNNDVQQKTGTDSSDCKMDTNSTTRDNDKTQNAKPFKTGTFLYLPLSQNVSDSVAKTARNRLVSLAGYIPQLQKVHDVHINMVTSKTTAQVKKTLQQAKAGVGPVKIYNHQDVPGKNDTGEWIFIRPKNSSDGDNRNRSNGKDMELLMDDLADRWSSFLTIRKRGSHDDSDEEDDEQPRKRL